MRSLRPCTSCARHVGAGATGCPFCGVTLPPLESAARAPARSHAASRLATVSLAAAFGATLAACYGGPPPPRAAPGAPPAPPAEGTHGSDTGTK